MARSGPSVGFLQPVEVPPFGFHRHSVPLRALHAARRLHGDARRCRLGLLLHQAGGLGPHWGLPRDEHALCHCGGHLPDAQAEVRRAKASCKGIHRSLTLRSEKRRRT